MTGPAPPPEAESEAAAASPAPASAASPAAVRPSVFRRMTGAVAVMVVLSSVANGLNYASSLVFSRVLEPVGFGELTSLLALAVVLAVPLGAAQAVVAERIAVARADGDEARVRYLVRYAIGHVATLALIVTGGYIACIPLVISLLDIREPGPAIALAPLVFVTFVNPVTAGVLQGLERYAAFGVLLFATAASRLLFGVPWALAGGGAGGAIAGQALGIVVVTLLIGWRYRGLLAARGAGIARRGMRRRVDLTQLSASGAFVGFALLSNVDLLLARVWLDAHDAGIYAALATIAKVVIFLPSAVAVVMVPSAARARARTGSGTGVLRWSALAVAGVAVLCAIPGVLVPGTVVDLMFGSDYGEAVSGVLPAIIAGTGLALINLVCIYSVTIRDRRWLALMAGGLVLQVTAIGLWHDTPTAVAWAQAATVAAVLLANELAFHSLLPGRRRGA